MINVLHAEAGCSSLFNCLAAQYTHSGNISITTNLHLHFVGQGVTIACDCCYYLD